MALWDEVAARYPARELIQLTNPEGSNNNTVDTTRSAAAVADATSVLKERAQVTFDATNADHVRVAVSGVIAFLFSYGGGGSGIARISIEEYQSACDRFAAYASRNRVTPATSSTRTPTTDTKDTPDWDDDVFADFIPDGPAAAEDD